MQLLPPVADPVDRVSCLTGDFPAQLYSIQVCQYMWWQYVWNTSKLHAHFLPQVTYAVEMTQEWVCFCFLQVRVCVCVCFGSLICSPAVQSCLPLAKSWLLSLMLMPRRGIKSTLKRFIMDGCVHPVWLTVKRLIRITFFTVFFYYSNSNNNIF